jgi:hypothetical protein
MSQSPGMFQSLAMLQSALQASAIQQSEPQQVGMSAHDVNAVQAGTPRQQLPAAALVGNLMGGRGGINPSKNELELAMLGGTQDLPADLLVSQDNLSAAARRYQQTRENRFGGNLGKMESIFDLVRGKRAHEDFLEAKNEYQVEATQYRQEQQNAMVQAEMQKRAEYVKNALPLITYANPELPHQAAVALATQAAAQNMPIEKLIPDGVPAPVREEYLDPETKATMARWRNPQTGAIMTGENWEPVMVKGAEKKTTGGGNTWKLTYDADGNEFQTYITPPDQNGEPQVLGSIPTGKNKDAKPISAMSAENKKYAPMLANSTSLVAQSLPDLFDADTGNWAGAKTLVPMSKQKIAILAYENAIRQSIRPESGAAVPESEVIAAFELYRPNWHDSDAVAQAKVQRFAEYQKRMYTSMFEGYTDIPENLLFTDYMQPWMDTPAAQEGAVLNAVEDANADLDARLRSAIQAAGIQVQ